MIAVILVDRSLIRPFLFLHVYHSKHMMYKQTPEIFYVETLSKEPLMFAEILVDWTLIRPF